MAAGATLGLSSTQGRRDTHIVLKFPQDRWEHGQGRFRPREAHLAEAGAVVADDGHAHGAVRGRAGLRDRRRSACGRGPVLPLPGSRCVPHMATRWLPTPRAGPCLGAEPLSWMLWAACWKGWASR